MKITQAEAYSLQFKQHISPHHDLVRATIEQALLDIEDGVIPVRALKDQIERVANAEKAILWINHRQRGKKALAPFSFCWCCEVLDYDPASIRRGILRGNAIAKIKELRRRVNERLKRGKIYETKRNREARERRAYLSSLTKEQRLEERRAKARLYMAAKRAQEKHAAMMRERKRIDTARRRAARKLEVLLCTTQLSQSSL